MRVYRYVWPFGYRALKAIIRHQLDLAGSQDQAGQSANRKLLEVVVVKEQR